jgi:acetylornithine/succinyldiaminopimelate/putrescine aminotransferase
MDKALAMGVIVNLTAKKVIRIAPPLNIEQGLWEQGLGLITQLIASL